jgi:hypothetical protein
MSEDKKSENNSTENKQSEMSEPKNLNNVGTFNLQDLDTVKQNIAAQKVISEELGQRRQRPLSDN